MVNTWTWLLTGVLIGGAGVWAWWSRRRVMHAPKADLRGVSAGVQGVLDAVPAHVAVLDARGTILATNRAWDDFGKIGGGVASVIGVGANYLDVCRRAMASEPCVRDGGGTSEATPTDSCAAGDVYQQLVAVLEGTRDAALVPYPCHAPDREQWFQMRASVLRSGRTRAERLVLVSHEDITLTTQQRLAERGQMTELAHADRVMTAGEMASGLAHELNQPLAAIMNYASGLRRGEALSERAASAIEEIERQADRARQIITRMRAFVRKGEFDPQPGDLVACVREAVALIEPDAHSAGVRIAIDAPVSVPGVRPFDAIQIQQLIVNLIRNATDSIATRSGAAGGKGTVRVSIEPSVGSVRVVVSDDGPGVPEGDRARLFEPFFTTKPHGTGLGLMICQKIAELHEGRLTYRPAGGGAGGAEFTLALPREVVAGVGGQSVASQVEARLGVTGANSEVAA